MSQTCSQCGQASHDIPCDVARGAHQNPAAAMKAELERTHRNLASTAQLAHQRKKRIGELRWRNNKLARQIKDLSTHNRLLQAELDRMLEDRRRDREEIDALREQLYDTVACPRCGAEFERPFLD